MKPITTKETLNNRFCKFDKKTKQVTITKPSKEEALKMQVRTVRLYIASSGLKFRPIEKATENANYWLTMPEAKSKIIITIKL